MRAARLPALFILLICASVAVAAQLRVKPVAELPDDVALRLAVRKLATTGTFMETTAHPDDEDNGLLAMMSHGNGMRTVLVSATRGDGGQNEIGPEIFQALGVLRTEELLAVHRFDGAEQYFTRAVDFGYSFSIDETIQKWGHDEIVGDYVRHIRAIRPDVIAGFLCGGDGGGQHHQASTRLTLDAFRAAADPSRYPDQIKEGLRPWQAKRVFCTEAFGARDRTASPDLLRVSTSVFDQLLGRTYAEVGLEGRSMHKCQGTLQLLLLPGAPGTRTYRLKDSVIGQSGAAPPDFFDGIDTTVKGLGAFAGAQPPAGLTDALQAIAADIAAAGEAAARTAVAATAPLLTGLNDVRALRARLGSLGLNDSARYEIDFRLAQKESQFQAALLLTHGVRLEALADDGTVVAGQRVKVSIVAGSHNDEDVSLKSVSLAGAPGNEGPVCVPTSGRIPKDGAVSCDATLTVGDHPFSTPYWTPRKDAARYDFEPDVPFGVPFRPTPFTATFTLSIRGVDVAIQRPIEYRYSDLFAGEKRMELQVVPPFAVRVTPEIAVLPAGASSASRSVQVTVSNNRKGPASASATLRLPEGWRAAPATAPVTFAREDEDVTVTFAVSPKPGVAVGEYAADSTVSSADGASSSLGYEVVEYPHVHRRHVVEPAHTRVKVIDVKLPAGLQVGYVMGVGDEMPAAIEQLGARVHLIDAAELAAGDLSTYHVIVTGVRAYERRADLRANNHRLLAYVEAGGTLLVNYNKQEFNQAQYGPYPAKVGTDRVTDEHAPVEVLVPSHPAFSVPNKITSADWSGWVQERGTYFLAEKDARYTDLVRLTDPFPLNPGAKVGALVEARYGKGRWIYLGLGLWRQLPAGTDGAYRLLANLLSLGKVAR